MARSKEFYDLLKLSSLGLEMGIAVVLGLLAGMFLDGRFGTSPWLTIFFTGCGFAAAGKAIARAIRESIALDENGSDEHPGQNANDNQP
jgi:ATP synthase protein I